MRTEKSFADVLRPAATASVTKQPDAWVDRTMERSASLSQYVRSPCPARSRPFTPVNAVTPGTASESGPSSSSLCPCLKNTAPVSLSMSSTERTSRAVKKRGSATRLWTGRDQFTVPEPARALAAPGAEPPEQAALGEERLAPHRPVRQRSQRV